MEKDCEFGLRKFERKAASKRAITVRKMVVQMAKNFGYSRKQTRFLSQVATLLNSSEEGLSLDVRARDILSWTRNHSDDLCRRLTWTKNCLTQARVLIATAANLDVAAEMLEEIPPLARAESSQLGQMLRYVEEVIHSISLWRESQSSGRRYAYLLPKPSKIEDDPQGDLLLSRRHLFESLPGKIQGYIQRHEQAA